MSKLRGGRSLISMYRNGGRLSVNDLLGPLWCEHKQYYDLVGLKEKGMLNRPLEFEVTRKVVIHEKVELTRKVAVNEPTQPIVRESGPAKEPKGTILPHRPPTTDEKKTLVAKETAAVKENWVEKTIAEEPEVNKKETKEKAFKNKGTKEAIEPTKSSVRGLTISKGPDIVTLPLQAPNGDQKQTTVVKGKGAKENLVKGEETGVREQPAKKKRVPGNAKPKGSTVGLPRDPKSATLLHQARNTDEKETTIAKEIGAKENVVEMEVIKETAVQEKPVEENRVKGSVEPKGSIDKEVGPPKEPISTTLPHPAPTVDEKRTMDTVEVVETERIVEKKIKMSVNERAVRVAEKHTARGQRIHNKLREEVAPKKPLILLWPRTWEERDANMIMEMIFGLLNLKEHGVWREFPLIGSIRGLSVNGSIDEVRLEPSPNDKGKNILQLSEIKTKPRFGRVRETVVRHHKIQMMLYKSLLDRLLSPTVDWRRLFKERGNLPRHSFEEEFTLHLKQFAESKRLIGGLKFPWMLETMGQTYSGTARSLNLVQPESNSELNIIYRRKNETVKQGSNRRRKARPVVDAGESAVTDKRSFMYDERYLQQGLDDAVGFWRGGPPERGVSADEAWKCKTCEYLSGCEWRAKKGWTDLTPAN